MLASVLAVPDSADAAFPGQNGDIIFWDGSTSGRGDGIFAASPSGGTPRQLRGGLHYSDGNPDWSPDGRFITFVSCHGEARYPCEVYVMDHAGGGLRAVTSNQFTESWPSWSPDGRSIVFEGDGNIRVVDVETGQERVLVSNGEQPAWSPDGQTIAFTGYDYDAATGAGSGDIFAVSPDGSNVRRLTSGLDEWEPSFGLEWSPDGRKLAFLNSLWQRKDRFMTVNADGSGLKEVPLADHVGLYGVGWSPDGRFLSVAFSEYRRPGGIAVFRPDGTCETTIATSDGPFGADWQPTASGVPVTLDCGGGGEVREPVFAWSVDPGVIGDGFDGIRLLDNGSVASALSPAKPEPLPTVGVPRVAVRFNGCDNLGWDTVTFYVDGVRLPPDSSSACTALAELTEGSHEVKLEVSDGPSTGSTTSTIDVRHHVIVGMGDSYGSGEGVTPPGGWANNNCRRSARSPQALAAKALEGSDPHSAVTFISLACSGATARDGLLGSQEEPPGEKAVEPQLTRATALTAGLQVDRVLLSVGGNDIGFGDVIITCAVFGRCPLEHRRVTDQDCEVQGIPGSCDREILKTNLHEQVQSDLVGLQGTYADVARSVIGTGLVDNPAKVMLTEYPRISTEFDYPGADTLISPTGTRYCDGALRPPFRSGIADEEFAWASQVVQDGDPATSGTFRFQQNLARDVDLRVRTPGLNTLIRQSPSGFTPVEGASKMFDGRGYCAPDETRYIVQLDDVDPRSEPTAPMHPNLAGQGAWGQVLGTALVASIGS